MDGPHYENEFSASIHNVSEDTFKQFRKQLQNSGTPETYERKYRLHGDDPRFFLNKSFGDLLLKYKISNKKCLFRVTEKFKMDEQGLNSTPYELSDVMMDFKEEIERNQLFIQHKYDLLPYTFTKAKEVTVDFQDGVELYKSMIGEFKIVHNRWIFSMHNIRYCCEYVTHYSNRGQYNIHFELEFDNLKTYSKNQLKFERVLKNNYFELISDKLNDSVDILSLYQFEIKRNFKCEKKKDVTGALFANKIDGVRMRALLFNGGLYALSSIGCLQKIEKINIYNIYIVLVEYIEATNTYFIIDVNYILEKQLNFNPIYLNVNQLSDHYYHGYVVDSLTAIKFIESTLSLWNFNTNKYYPKMDLIKSLPSNVPTDGFLQFDQKSITKIKNNHTIEVEFSLTEMLVQFSNFNPKNTLNTKQYKSQLQLIKPYKRDGLLPSNILKMILENLPTKTILQIFIQSLFTGDDSKLINNLDDGIDWIVSNDWSTFLSQALTIFPNVRDVNLIRLNRRCLFEFEWRANENTFIFLRRRKDKLMADSLQKILNIMNQDDGVNPSFKK